MEETDQDSTLWLTFDMVVAVIEKLGFISQKNIQQLENDELTTEKILLLQLWEILHGDHYKGVHRRNLLVFLLAVLGLSVEIPSTKDLIVEKGKANTMRRDFEDNSMMKDMPPPPVQDNYKCD